MDPGFEIVARQSVIRVPAAVRASGQASAASSRAADPFCAGSTDAAAYAILEREVIHDPTGAEEAGASITIEGSPRYFVAFIDA